MNYLVLEQSVYPGYSYSSRPSPSWNYQATVPYSQSVGNYRSAQVLMSSAKPLTAQPRVKQVDKYSVYLDYKVGSGCSSVVYRGRNNRTQEEVCVKHVDCGALLPGQKSMVMREAQFLRQLNHPNILMCSEVLDSGNSLYIITEYCQEGDLYEKIMREGVLSEHAAFQLMKGVASALYTLKKYGIIHRDIKPSNVLLKNGVPKLADFGFAIHESQARQQARINIGSPLYMPPEVLFHNRYSFASDIFGFGIMYYELLHLVTPWESTSEDELKAKLAYNPQVRFREGISAGLRQLLAACLQLDPARRPTIEQVLQCFG